MKISDHGLRLLKEWEGCKLQKYRDAGGKWTIGVGHLLTKEELMGGKYDDDITMDEALSILAADLHPVERHVSCLVSVPIRQHEFDALVSFVFNVGMGAFRKSTLLNKLNAGRYEEVPQELRKWVRVGGKRCLGLAHRREQEIALWKGEL